MGSRLDKRWVAGGVGAAVLVVFGVIGSCTVLGGDGSSAAAPTTTLAIGDARPDPDQIADLDAPGADGPTTTDAATTTSTTEAGGEPTDGADPGATVVPERVGTAATEGNCVAIERAVLPPAEVITSEDFATDDDDRATRPGASIAELRLVAALVPGEHRAQWASALDSLEAATGEVPEEVADGLAAAKDAVEPWARQVCPNARPSWRCNQFGSTRDSVIDLEEGEGSASTPHGVLAVVGDEADAVELDRTSEQVLYGWLDGDGFVVRTFQVGRVEGGWAFAGYHECLDAP